MSTSRRYSRMPGVVDSASVAGSRFGGGTVASRQEVDSALDSIHQTIIPEARATRSAASQAKYRDGLQAIMVQLPKGKQNALRLFCHERLDILARRQTALHRMAEPVDDEEETPEVIRTIDAQLADNDFNLQQLVGPERSKVVKRALQRAEVQASLREVDQTEEEYAAEDEARIWRRRLDRSRGVSRHSASYRSAAHSHPTAKGETMLWDRLESQDENAQLSYYQRQQLNQELPSPGAAAPAPNGSDANGQSIIAQAQAMLATLAAQADSQKQQQRHQHDLGMAAASEAAAAARTRGGSDELTGADGPEEAEGKDERSAPSAPRRTVPPPPLPDSAAPEGAKGATAWAQQQQQQQQQSGTSAATAGGAGPAGSKQRKRRVTMHPDRSAVLAAQGAPAAPVLARSMRTTKSARALQRQLTGAAAIIAALPLQRQQAVRLLASELGDLICNYEAAFTRWQAEMEDAGLDEEEQDAQEMPEVMQDIDAAIADRRDALIDLLGVKRTQVVLAELRDPHKRDAMGLETPGQEEDEGDVRDQRRWRRRLGSVRRLHAQAAEERSAPIGRDLWNKGKRDAKEDMSYYERQASRYGRGRRGSTSYTSTWGTVLDEAEQVAAEEEAARRAGTDGLFSPVQRR